MTPYAVLLFVVVVILLLSSLFHRMAYHLAKASNAAKDSAGDLAPEYAFAGMIAIVIACIALAIGALLFFVPS